MSKKTPAFRRSAFAQNFFHALDHIYEAGAFQGVEDVFSSPFIDNDPGVFQDGQMPRQGGHIDLEHFENMADAQFSIGEFFDDLQARRMAESLENLGLPLNGQLGRFCGTFHGEFLLTTIFCILAKCCRSVKRVISAAEIGKQEKVGNLLSISFTFEEILKN